MKTPKICCLLTAIALAQSSLFGVSTDPVGFVSVSVPANSDAVLAVPLNRAAEFKGVIQSISGNVITVAGTPAWTANAFAPGVTANKTYAVQIAGGAKEGMIGRVTANGTNTITVALDSGDDLTNIGTVAAPLDPDGAGPLTAQADQIDIMPYWTPGSLLPTTLGVGVQFFGFTGTPAGTNLAAVQIYSHTGSGVWENGDDFSDASDIPLPFASAFILRNSTSNVQNISFVGTVPMTTHRVRFGTLASNKAQDIRFGYTSPVPTTLAQAGLTGTGSPAASGDQILIFNNSQTGFNKAAAQILEFDGTDWTDGETFEVVTNTFQFTPGFGYLYRKFGTPAPVSVVWQDVQTYLQ